MQKIVTALFFMCGLLVSHDSLSAESLSVVEQKAAQLVKECPKDFFARSNELLKSVPASQVREAYAKSVLGRILTLVHPDLLPPEIAFQTSFLACWVHLVDYQEAKKPEHYQTYVTCIDGLRIGRSSPAETKQVVACLK